MKQQKFALSEQIQVEKAALTQDLTRLETENEELLARVRTNERGLHNATTSPTPPDIDALRQLERERQELAEQLDIMTR